MSQIDRIPISAIGGILQQFEREKKLRREILAFSILHDNETMRIYEDLSRFL